MWLFKYRISVILFDWHLKSEKLKKSVVQIYLLLRSAAEEMYERMVIFKNKRRIYDLSELFCAIFKFGTMSRNVIVNLGWIRGPSKSRDQYPRWTESFFLKFLYWINISTEILEIVALNVPFAIDKN